MDLKKNIEAAGAFLGQVKTIVDDRLKKLIPSPYPTPANIYKSMRYSLLAGGKRLRPALCMASCSALGADRLKALDCACALEMIHCYSLIHDDLPCMDNDDLRRGMPTNHKVFGEAVALLGGDALLTYAFEVLGFIEGIDDHVRAMVFRETASACGPAGLIGGQVIDLESEGKKISYAKLKSMHLKKTGQLIKASVVTGGLIGGASERILKNLTLFGLSLGLVFQIADDLLDLSSDTKTLGKTAGKDKAQKKCTYPLLLGEKKARLLLDKTVKESLSLLSACRLRDTILKDLVLFAAYRNS